MNSGTFKEFMAKVKEDAGLRQELKAAGAEAGMPVEAVAALAARHGYRFSAEDVTSELSDRQLEAVAGGLARSLGRETTPTKMTNMSPPSPLMYKDLVANLYLSSAGSLMMKW